MINNLQRSRFAVWSVVILFLIVGLLSAWETVEEEAANTALIVASKRIVEQANLYKQQYLLKGNKQKTAPNNQRFIVRRDGLCRFKASREIAVIGWINYIPKRAF